MSKLKILMLLLAIVATSASAFAEGVLIRCERPCDAAKAAVARAEGVVTIEYQYINAIAAEVPSRELNTLAAALPAGAVAKDVIVEIPTAVAGRDGRDSVAVTVEGEIEALGSEGLAGAAEANPDGFWLNSSFINIGSLFSGGLIGNGIKVAVIDSGMRPGSPLVTFNRVVGGENFVPGHAVTSWNAAANGTHGSFVAGMIAHNVSFGPSVAFRNAVAAHCGAPCFVGGNVNGNILAVGSAPGSLIYALKVFAATGGSPTSRILLAGERVITLRRNFEDGIAETVNANGTAAALDIKVCNMSLGGPTTHAAGDLYEELAQAMQANDIVLVTSAGNAGPSGSTGGSPGTSTATIAVGAASTAMHERIRWDFTNPGFGVPLRPTSHTQTALFSSRGPTADGRNSPHVTANGDWSLSHTGAGFTVSSGTSFSAPTVAGVAATLRQAHPSATARQIRNAIIMGANPNLFGDNSGPNDQGFGFVDAAASNTLLAGGAVPDTLPSAGPSNRNLNVNIVRGAGINPESDTVVTTATLVPGERLETYYKVGPNTSAVIVTLSDVVKGSPQNVLFGDDFRIAIHSAKTSAFGQGDYHVNTFSSGGTWVIPNPESGLMRVTALGEWTNGSSITGTVTITSISSTVPGNLAQAKIVSGEFAEASFVVPQGAGQLVALLEWPGDWGAYPTNDLDLYLVRPNGTTISSGATFNSPERVVVNNPPAGTWTALIHGFTIHNSDERYKLAVTVDGQPARKK